MDKSGPETLNFYILNPVPKKRPGEATSIQGNLTRPHDVLLPSLTNAFLFPFMSASSVLCNFIVTYEYVQRGKFLFPGSYISLGIKEFLYLALNYQIIETK